MLDQQRDYVLRTVEERGVRLVRLWFTDVLGNLKSFAISPAELENALEDGMTFDGSSIDGFSRIQEADVLAIPDPDTFELLPWGEPGASEARVIEVEPAVATWNPCLTRSETIAEPNAPPAPKTSALAKLTMAALRIRPQTPESGQSPDQSSPQ